jgi:trans-aconitate 2-methyltransferase
MVEETRARLGDAVDARVADLLDLTLEAPVDAVLSTATLHWILDHDRVFASLRDVLKPGGRMVVQCGGAGNVANVQAAIDTVAEPALEGWPGPWNFAATEETADRLRRLGFVDVWTWPQEIRVTPDDPLEYLSTIVLGSHLERLEPERREPFARAVLAAMDEPVVEYVRLNILARRPA